MWRTLVLNVAAALVGALAGCATPAVERQSSGSIPARDCCRSVPADWRQRAIVRTAVQLVGATTVESHGRRIAYDCAGVARAIYLAHGIDLYEVTTADRHANGVKLIYEHVRERGRLHYGPVVQAGDLVFFNNTWDSNGDGKDNDPLTHVGIVERVERDGTILFISRVAEAIERYRMNLHYPHMHGTSDGRILNDYMRRKRWSDGKATRYLTGELFAGFGTRLPVPPDRPGQGAAEQYGEKSIR